MKDILSKARCLLCLFAASMMVFCLGASANNVNGISVSQSTLIPGEEFTLYITIPPLENADTASIRAEFDESAFETVQWSPEVSGGISGYGDGYVSLAAANAERLIDLSEGMELTAVMKVKEDAGPGDHSFELVKNSLAYVDDSGMEFIELWEPEETTAVVTVAARSQRTAEEEQRTAETPEQNNGIMAAVLLAAAALAALAVLITVIAKRSRKK